MLYAISKLDTDHLQKVQNVEKATGTRILALNALDVTPAEIQEGMLEDIQALENELGLTLVAVE